MLSQMHTGGRSKKISGPTAKQMKEFWDQVSNSRISRALFQMFLNDPGVVLPQQILEQLIVEAEFDEVDKDLTSEYFLVETMPNPDTELVLVQFGEQLKVQDAVEKLGKQGLVPAEIEYLLMYIAENPEEKDKDPIIALGSVVRGKHNKFWYYPRVDIFLGNSRLSFYIVADNDNDLLQCEGYRFLARCENKQTGQVCEGGLRKCISR